MKTKKLFAATLLGAVIGLTGCGGGGGTTASAPTPTPPTEPTPPVVNGPAWFGFGRDAQHTAVGAIATQPLTRVVWTTPVDLAPQYSNGGALLIHYGSPVITAKSTVVVPVKTTSGGGFRIEARAGANGALVWSANSDYVLPTGSSWTPSYNIVLTTANRVYAPGAGGKVLYRDDADAVTGNVLSAVFYGANNYTAAIATYDTAVRINTPLTSDAQGNIYFGFVVTGATPANLSSGIARVAADGSGTWVSAAAAAGVVTIGKPATNSAPALSVDGRTLYVAVNTNPQGNTRQSGYLLALDATTLATKSKIQLTDPLSGTLAWVSDNSTSSPTVGPDGDVYFGVLEANAPAHNFRGWLLHFDANLTTGKTSGSFGWDDTASIVPASMVPSYTGPSAYLLMTKYNNYGGSGSGDGKNRVAILDPNVSQPDSIANVPVMREVMTILGTTPDPDYPNGVKEWCINTAAVDPLTRSVLANSEDGYLYRWDLTTNTFSERIKLNNGFAESYTPTAIGPDGKVYAVNNAALFAVGR